jgi:hypothetical protein
VKHLERLSEDITRNLIHFNNAYQIEGTSQNTGYFSKIQLGSGTVSV